MQYNELISEIVQLPLDKRLALLELLAHSVRTEITPKATQGSSVERVRGLLKPDGEIPTDREITEDYTNYLIEKYS